MEIAADSLSEFDDEESVEAQNEYYMKKMALGGFEGGVMPSAAIRAKALHIMRSLKDQQLRQRYRTFRTRPPPPPKSFPRKPPFPSVAHTFKSDTTQEEAVQQSLQFVPTPPTVPLSVDRPHRPHVETEPAKPETKQTADPMASVRYQPRRMHVSFNDWQKQILPKQILSNGLQCSEARVMHFKYGGSHDTIGSLEQDIPPPRRPPRRRYSGIVAGLVVVVFAATHTEEQQPQTRPSLRRPLPEEISVTVPLCQEYSVLYSYSINLAAGVPEWEHDGRRFVYYENRWHIEHRDYYWVESVDPHGGKPPSSTERWKRWDPVQLRWIEDPSLYIIAAEDTSGDLWVKGCDYAGRYLHLDGSRVDGMPMYVSGDLQVVSMDGRWILHDSSYVTFRSGVTLSSYPPGDRMMWEQWDGVRRVWHLADVILKLRYSTRHSSFMRKESTSETFLTEAAIEEGGLKVHSSARLKSRVSETSRMSKRFSLPVVREEDPLMSHLPKVTLPQITVLDVLSGKVMEKDPAKGPEADSKQDEEERENSRMVETLLFGFHSQMSTSEAKRVLGLVYRPDDHHSASHAVPYDYQTFYKTFGMEKVQFHVRCSAEISRMAKQRISLFTRKRRLLQKILMNTPDAKANNPRWRDAYETLQSQVFHDVQKEFMAKRRFLLQVWLQNCRDALPPVQSPACESVMEYLEEVFDVSEVALDRSTFHHLCYRVLDSQHFLLNDVIRLLWCIKKVFQVSDEYFCDVVRDRTKVLFTDHTILPELEKPLPHAQEEPSVSSTRNRTSISLPPI